MAAGETFGRENLPQETETLPQQLHPLFAPPPGAICPAEPAIIKSPPKWPVVSESPPSPPWPATGMPTRSLAISLILLALAAGAGNRVWGADSPQSFPFSDSDLEFFEKRVRPILASRCYDCHSGRAKALKGGLRLDSREAVLQGGETGPAAVPGDREKSLLIDAIEYGDLYQMPPTSKLPEAEIAVLATWVQKGLPWPPESPPTGDTGDSKGATPKTKEFDLHARRAAHWAWRPVSRDAAPPETKNRDWPRDPVDRFVLAKLEAEGLTPAPPAERQALLRRVYFDLIGLPPTPEQRQRFLADETPLALEHVVDELLGSRQFAERWARHWLDLVRYAETRGHEFEPIIPNAWQYRDYVIRALEADVPYDRFLMEHIAGDILETPRPHPSESNPSEHWNEAPLGTGFWFLGEEVHSPVDIRQDEMDRVDNRLDVFSKTFLALTVSCARCHDHKFDAISQRDYYALAGFVISGAYRQFPFDTFEENQRVAEDALACRIAARSEILARLADCAQAETDTALEYLLAARQAVAAATGGASSEALSNTGQAALDPARLQAWIEEWKAADADVSHPLRSLTAPQESTASEGAPHETPPPKTVQTLVDYSRPEAPWYASGFAFGLGPAQPGDPKFAGNGAWAGLYGAHAAERDHLWDGLSLAPGVERDVGSVGDWDRVGRVVRTPETTLNANKLWYWTRGLGRAYAVVNSHLIVVGPLHGRVLKEWQVEEGKWQWVEHDLTPYRGHRLHVEFSPLGENDVGIAQVVAADECPPVPMEFRSREARPTKDVSPDALATRVRQSLALSIESLRDAQTEIADPKLAGAAKIADWFARRADLFALPDDRARRELSASIERIVAERAELAKRIRTGSQAAPVMWESNGVNETLLIRGNSKTPAGETPRRLLEALGDDGQEYGPASSGRLSLARRLVDPANPLVSRVIVNRIWGRLFGRGIVPSVDNFGALGDAPTHPELLDWLATEFTRDGWSIKRLIRKLVLSETYRMSSAPRPAEDQLDPLNLWLHRAPLKRLEGEAIRDAILATSGRLDPTSFGPSVPIHLTPFMDGRGRPKESGPLDGAGRRSIYISTRRNFLSPLLLAFDMPPPFSTVGRRATSNVPAQALFLMNDPFVLEQAGLWAKRLLTVADETPSDRVTRMYEMAFCREPTASEMSQAIDFLREQSRKIAGASSPSAAEAAPSDEAWADLCHVMYNVKEFVFVP